MLLVGLFCAMVFFMVDDGTESLTGPQWIVGPLAMLTLTLALIDQFKNQQR